MGLFLANGTRVTESTLDKTAAPDPSYVLNTDLFLREPFQSAPEGSKNVAGDKLTLFARAGKTLKASEIAAMFPDPVITAITPATGTTAGGTVVTIDGENLDGVTAVSFGGTNGTSVLVKSPRKLTVVTPAKTAGAKDVVVTDDGGIATATNGFTYA